MNIRQELDRFIESPWPLTGVAGDAQLSTGSRTERKEPSAGTGMRVVARPAVDRFSEQRFHNPGASGALDGSSHRMVAHRMVAGSGSIEDDHAEIARAVRGHRESPTELEAAALVPTDRVINVTAQTELVADLAQHLRLVSAVGKMTTLATEPVNRPVRDPLAPPDLVLVTGEADATAGSPQKARLAGGVRRMAIDALGELKRRVRYRGVLDFGLQVGVAGVAKGGTAVLDQH
jgi:hypothetical protein